MVARRLIIVASILPALFAAGWFAYALGAGSHPVAMVEGVRADAALRGMLGAIVFPWMLAIAARYLFDPVGDGACLCCGGEACGVAFNAVVGAPASLAVALMIVMVVVKRPRFGLTRVWSAALVAGVVTGVLFHLTDLRVAAYAAAACPNHTCGG